MDRPRWAPAEVDLTRPSVARVYDYYLGGSHNFESDRDFARQVLEFYPELPSVTQDNRAFLRRAVQYLCRQGIDQFLDLGSGIPTVGNVHEVAHALDPAARVIYVDRDPVAVTHSRALLEGVERTAVLAADLLEPEQVLEEAVRTGGLDLDRPVAVLLVSVLHFVDDEQRPADLVATYMARTAPGSHLTISHARADGKPVADGIQSIYNQPRSPNPMRFRTTAEITALFGDLTLVDPGVVHLPRWRPDSAEDLERDAPDYPGLAGMGRRD